MITQTFMQENAFKISARGTEKAAEGPSSDEDMLVGDESVRLVKSPEEPESCICPVCGGSMVLLDSDAGRWYCDKDDEVVYTKEPPKELHYARADNPQAATLVYVGEIVFGAIVTLVILHGWLIPQGMISRDNSELGF